MKAPGFDVVVPTLGRSSLRMLLASLAAARGPRPRRILIVDDRRHAGAPVDLGTLPEALALRVRVLTSGGRGPAAARNVGWRLATEDWVAFLDDDVVVDRDWPERLADDLASLGHDVAASQGRIRVPLPEHRRPTDWERNVAALQDARWATADMAYRRSILAALGGFDERFPRAYREDADLALRALDRGFRLVQGARVVVHPVRAADGWVSVRLQRGNADDVLMRALHGRSWRARAAVPRGRRRRHLAIVGAALGAAVAWSTGHRRLAGISGALAASGIAELAWARIAPGPRTPDEVARMVLTSVALPFAATGHWLAGVARLPRLIRQSARAPRPVAGRELPSAVLFDRDGTLIVDVPYNADPSCVVPVAGARAALQRLRDLGVPLAVVTNQSGVDRGLLSLDDVRAVNRRVESLLGPLGPWMVCRHRPDDACRCRKPAPGLVLAAADALGVEAAHCVVIGDTGADVRAAHAAGARGILVPNDRTRLEEIADAPEVAGDLDGAVDLVLGEGPRARDGLVRIEPAALADVAP